MFWKLIGALIAWYLLMLIVAALFTMDSSELRMRSWRLVAVACQKVAHAVGRVGLLAENRYNLSRSTT